MEIKTDNELNYYAAQMLTEEMFREHLISEEEFVILTNLNRSIFSPFLAEILPNPLDLFPKER